MDNGHLIILAVIVRILLYIVIDTFLLYIPILNVVDDVDTIKSNELLQQYQEIQSKIPEIEKELCLGCSKFITTDPTNQQLQAACLGFLCSSEGKSICSQYGVKCPFG